MARGNEQVVRPGRGALLRHAELTPEVTEMLDVRNLVVLESLPQPFEPGVPGGIVHVGAHDQRDEVDHGVAHRRTDGARGAVHLLDGRGDALEEEHGTFGRAEGDPSVRPS